MRTAYALLGIVWVIIIVALWWGVTRSFTPPGYSGVGTNSSSTISMATTSLTISSPDFENGGMIPSRYTCDDSAPHNPPLQFSGVPEKAQSLVLIVDDPDVPKQILPGGVYDHWVLFNITPNTGGIAEGASVGIAGANGSGKSAYAAPCPPPQYQPSEHRYFFKLYALDTTLGLAGGATKAQVEEAMQGHVIAQAELMGRYKRR